MDHKEMDRSVLIAVAEHLKEGPSGEIPYCLAKRVALTPSEEAGIVSK